LLEGRPKNGWAETAPWRKLDGGRSRTDLSSPSLNLMSVSVTPSSSVKDVIQAAGTQTASEAKPVRPQVLDPGKSVVELDLRPLDSPEARDKRAAVEKLEETMKELQQHVELLGKCRLVTVTVTITIPMHPVRGEEAEVQLFLPQSSVLKNVLFFYLHNGLCYQQSWAQNFYFVTRYRYSLLLLVVSVLFFPVSGSGAVSFWSSRNRIISSSSKSSKKTLDFYCFVNEVIVPSTSYKQKNTLFFVGISDPRSNKSKKAEVGKNLVLPLFCFHKFIFSKLFYF
jgi:hypothetical protein